MPILYIKQVHREAKQSELSYWQGECHAYVITPWSSGFFHHISGKNERIQTKLGSKKLRHKGNPQENLGAYSERGVPTRLDFFVTLIYVASLFDPLRTENTADFGVESRT